MTEVARPYDLRRDLPGLAGGPVSAPMRAATSGGTR
jgi:hypothetical protein